MRTAVVLALALSVQVAAQALPSGFVDETVASGFDRPISLSFLPDGRALVAEQDGTLQLVVGGQRVEIGTVPGVRAVGAEGVVGLTCDPGWPARPYIYAFYNAAVGPELHLARLTLTGSTHNPASTALSVGDVHLILTGIQDQTGAHNGGTIAFGPNDHLFVSLGEDFSDCRAQDLDDLGGAILRLDVSNVPAGPGGPPPHAQLIAAGNPFTGNTDAARLVWATGLREPFRFDMDPATGTLFIADVGSTSVEEINVADQPGLNFGWPYFEGTLQGPGCQGLVSGLTQPVVAWDRRTAGVPTPAAFISLAFYRHDAGATAALGASYDGSYFYCDFFEGAIRRLVHNGQTWVDAPAVPGQPAPRSWAEGYSGVPDGAIGPDGALWYVHLAQGRLGRIRPSGLVRRLTVVDGSGQVANALTDLPQPVRVRLTDGQGQPIAGEAVRFQDAAGSGASFDPAIAVTDSLGEASTTVTLGSARPQLFAVGDLGGSVQIAATWRGLFAAEGPAGRGTELVLAIVHSATNAPLGLCIEPPGLTTPFLTSRGDVVVGILNPTPQTILIDGTGIFGPLVPSFRTRSEVPEWSSRWPVPAGLSGWTVVLQAFGIDPGLTPPHDAMISNPVVVTFQ